MPHLTQFHLNHNITFILFFGSMLGHNPYVCDCNMAWFIKQRSSIEEKLFDLYGMKCAGPVALKGQDVEDMSRFNLCNEG